jgi:pimeloyl-ACP methyl ester carboxylesterase
MLNRSLMKFLLITLLLYTGFAAYLYFFQRSLMYFPQPRRIPDAPFIILQRPDARIQVTTHALEEPDALLYFGGNAEDVSVNLPDFARQFPHHALYLMHYRGYGDSDGKPMEDAIMADALALFDAVAEKHQRIAVAGRSLGTGVAVRLAAERPVSRAVLITPYDSIEYVASRAFPYMPVGWMLKDKYESWRYAPQVSAPTLILMAENDEVIPAESTERLHRLFHKGVSTMRVIPEARHNSISFAGAYENALTGFINAGTTD